jgi:O-antigen/teichoic acid export membrane protein
MVDKPLGKFGRSQATGKRIAGQGALLFSGFAAAQLLAFARNAILGHMLARGDFGLAATLTLLLQLLETLTDLGADRLIVQARDGHQPHFVACQHTALVLRGVLIAMVLYLSADATAAFFSVSEAAWAFAAIAGVPLIKGFQNLDARRAQRHLDNRPYLLIEVVPQAVALALTYPIVRATPDFSAVISLSFVQALAMVLISHSVARRGYAMDWDPQILRRLISFGWPIWLSAFPLIAVFHGDRIVIARLLGMDALAAYTAAFMIAMVPGLIAAKVGHALMLPLFASARNAPRQLEDRFTIMSEATVFLASLYLVTLMLIGGLIVALAFGQQYLGLDILIAWLAAMWAVRMIQAVPGMALMARGETRPFLIAGLIRAFALIPAAYAAAQGAGLSTIAAAGVGGEIASVAYITLRLRADEPKLALIFAYRSALLLPAAGAGILFTSLTAADHGLGVDLAGLLVTIGVVTAMALAASPLSRRHVRTTVDRYMSSRA